MSTAQTFALASREIVAEDFDGEFVVLDLRSGKYFSLAQGASLLWRALLAGHSLATLTAGLGEADPRRTDAARVVDLLVGSGLLAATDGASSGPDDLVAEFAASNGAFTVDVFDDLADLLVADPIHDVDPEAGWPHLPPKA